MSVSGYFYNYKKTFSNRPVEFNHLIDCDSYGIHNEFLLRVCSDELCQRCSLEGKHKLDGKFWCSDTMSI